ncbi:tetratricopeptide repeat protein [Chryseobacterium sp. C-71]|uniref:T9SS type A sorting domain-containing protein n=1 Tax=Chryseobacterium sp. C-71 TaxID=2893882 RepID=UPI001E2D22A7|nr:tetratricopeptide repeat protein [Chryseobacterium sp. C-71]UFH33186.1 tetratricopeptide repeat protein [Chryseobacterium sp. C-71]
MMKKVYVLIFTLSLFLIHAQNTGVDSLIHALYQTTDVSLKTELLNTISDAYKNSDPDAMQKYAHKALVNAKKIHNKKEEAKALQNLGTSYIILGNYNDALKYFNLSEKILSGLDQNDKIIKEALAKVFGSKGIVYSEQNNYAKALENDFKAMKLYESIDNKVQLSKIYNNIGVIYDSIDDDIKALNYYLKAYKIQKEIKDPNLAVSCSNIGLIYLTENNLVKAKQFFDESLKEFQKSPNGRGMGELYNNISQYYVVKKDLKTAKNYLLKAEEICKSTENQFGLSNTYLFLARIYFNENDLNRSSDFVNKSLKISRDLDLPEAVMNCEKLLSEISDKKGNKEQAFLHLKNYNIATNDEFFEHMKLKINDGTSTGETFVKNNGKYDFYTPAGTFTVTAEPENPTLFTVTPFTFTTSFPNNNNNIFTQNICVTKNGNANDLEVVIAPETNATPGFDAKYKLMWRNKGNTTLSGNVTLTFDSSKMTFMSSVLPYASIVGNQITFNFSNLKPYANTASEIIFKINTPTHPTNPVNSGDILNFSAVVNPLAGDFKPEDNSFSYKQTVVNSFDPNDIVCIEGNSIPQSMVGKYLHYIVNFENTGTAPATNIVVEMDIDPNDFDISTLQLQNASHQVYTRVKDNKVEFIMEYANLGNGGHGNILMKMLSKNTLASGDNVNNKANIYFDYNFPIVTNDAITTIESGSVLQTVEAKIDNSIAIFPIPTNGEVNINADSKISSIEVYDIQGRIIQKQIGINNQSTKLTIHSNSSGVFLFKVNTEKGILIKKVIKN